MKRLSSRIAGAMALAAGFALGTATPARGGDMSASIRKFTQVYEAVEANFADKAIPADAIYTGAIPSMLRTLDPHSSFLDPKAYRLLQEEQSGHYFGVGMLVGEPEGKVVVIYPFSGSPAFQAGVRPGDRILSVDGNRVDRLDVNAVSALLKGPRGTKVRLETGRAGAPKSLAFELTRAEVPRASVTESFWLRPGIAFIKIESFNENTGHEFDRALAHLGESSIQGMILDLRDNGGGILQESVAVADRLLRKGQPIVSHHGRASAETKFVARHGERGADFPIVVLVNRNTASAAEILSGALQDHDRAWLLGEKTFGKGLVQAPYTLSGDTALLLTIARYYTPSGRLIQRDYAHQSFYDYFVREVGKTDYRDSRKTDGGRPVFGGDGIAPDQEFHPAPLTTLEENLDRDMTYFFFAADYFGTHPASLSRDWRPDGALMKMFREFIPRRGIACADAEFLASEKTIRGRLREEMWVTAFSREDADRIALEADPEVDRAIHSLPSSKALLEKVRDVVAEKRHRQQQELAR